MEAKLFSHSEKGGFNDKEEVRSWVDEGLRGDGKYLLARLFNVPTGSIAFFEVSGSIIGCAIVSEEARELSEEEKFDYKEDTGEDWKAVIIVDPVTIWAWLPEQDVNLKEAGIQQFLPGPPMPLNARNVLKIFELVANTRR